MARFLICSFILVLLYPSGIDMYLVGLPRIAAELNASEAQMHMAFSVYLVGMAIAMLFAGKISDQSGRKPVAITGAAIFIIASVLCAWSQNSIFFMIGRFIQGIGAGSCYVIAYAILRDTLNDTYREKVLSLLNGVICIMPVLAPVLGYLIMLRFPWQSLFYSMAAMSVIACLIAVFILKETRQINSSTPEDPGATTESLTAPFFLSRMVIITLSVSVILTLVNTSPVLLMEAMGFERREYATFMAMTSVVSMTVSFATPFALNFFMPRMLMMASQWLFLLAGLILVFSSSHTMILTGLILICMGFPLGFGVAMSQALGPFSQRAGVASSTLGIAQVCGSSLWIWLTAMAGISSLNMLTGVLIGCSIVSLTLLMFFPYNKSLT